MRYWLLKRNPTMDSCNPDLLQNRNNRASLLHLLNLYFEPGFGNLEKERCRKKQFIHSMTPRNKLQVVYGRKRIDSLKFFWQPVELTLSYSRVVGAMVGSWMVQQVKHTEAYYHLIPLSNNLISIAFQLTLFHFRVVSPHKFPKSMIW